MKTLKGMANALPTREVDYVALEDQIAWIEYQVALHYAVPGNGISKWDFILDSLREYKKLRDLAYEN